MFILCNMVEQKGVQLFQIQTMRHSTQSPLNLPLSIHPQCLHLRKTLPLRPILNAPHRPTCHPSHHTSLHSYLHKHKQHSPQYYRDVDWIKYNVIVGIYENWIRLYPYIQHLLGDRENKDKEDLEQNGEQTVRNKKYLCKRTKENKDNVESLNQLFQRIVKRKQELSQKGIHNLSLQRDLKELRTFAHLSKQLINALPAEHQKWNKSKLQNHNHLIDSFLNNPDTFHLNYDAIVNSLKERLRFISEMQQKMLKTNHHSKQALNEKLSLLRQPFNLLQNEKTTNKKKERFGTILSALKEEPGYKQLKKKGTKNKIDRHPGSRHTVYRINRKASNPDKEYTVDQEWFNKSEGMNRMNGASIYCEEPEEHEDIGEDQKQSNRSKHSIRINAPNQSIIEFHIKPVDRNKLSQKDSMSKVRRRGQASSSSKMSLLSDPTKAQTRDSVPRSSQLSTHLLQPDQICRSNIRKGTTLIPSIQEIDQNGQIIQDAYFSKQKSHKKIGTLKHIKEGRQKRNRANGRGTKLGDNIRNSVVMRGFGKGSKLIKNGHKKENFWFESRKGNFMGKGSRKISQVSLGGEEQMASIEPADYLGKRAQIVAFFKAVFSSGVLSGDQHGELRERADELIHKCSPQIMAQNRKYASLIQERIMLPSVHQEAAPESFMSFLTCLHTKIKNDSQIGVKIRNQWDGIMGSLMEEIKGQRGQGYQQFWLHSVQAGKLKQQLHRAMEWKQQGERMGMGLDIIRRMRQLGQKEVPQ